MINLELYKIFFVVADTGNITKASEKLNISQPAVTKHIKNLEYELGEPLFIRTKKGVVLNEYGKKIYLNVKTALNLLDEVEKRISECKDSHYGNITIGVSTSLTRKFLLKYIEKFHKLYPNIKVTLFTESTKDSIKKLKNGMIDFIISKFPNNIDMDLDYYKLGTTKYIFTAAEEYKELFNRKVDVKELIKYPILLQKYPSNSYESADKYFKKYKIDIEPSMSIGSSNLLVDFTKIGYGVGYVTKLYVESELKNGKLVEIDMKQNTENIDYGIITLKNNILSSCCNLFINYIKKQIK